MNGMALGTILTQSTGSNQQSANAAKHTPASLSKNLTRLISAAVVSASFRNLLLTDPMSALATGYNGEHFDLTPIEQAIVTSLRANNIRDFASRLLSLWQNVTGDALAGIPPGGELQYAEVAIQPADATRDLPASFAHRRASHRRSGR